MSTKAKTSVIVTAVALVLMIRFVFAGKSGVAVFSPATDAAEPGLSYNYDSGASFYSFNSKDFYFCTKDGVKFISSKGEQLWQDVISLTSPVLYGKCDVIAVGEPRGRTVYVFNAFGKIMEQKFDAPVQSFSVNKTGYITVILQTASGYRIETYGPGSENAIWQYVLVKPDVYPISADTSSDGKITAVSLLDLTPDARHNMTSRILFIYTNKSDALKIESADGIFAGETLPGQIAKVYFMDDRLLTVSDKMIIAYSIGSKDTVKTDWELKLKNKISQFCLYGEAGFGFIGGEPFPDSEDQPDIGVLEFYNMNGRRTGRFACGEADYLSMNWGSAIVGNGRNFSAISSRGVLIWQYKSPKDLNQIIFLDNENTLLTADSTHAVIMRRGA